MPLIAAAAIAATTVTYVGLGVAIAFNVGTFFFSLALSAISAAVFKAQDPGTSAESDANARNLTVRQAAASRRLIYGQTRTGGVYAFLDSETQFDTVVTTSQFAIPAERQITIPGYVSDNGVVSVEEDNQPGILFFSTTGEPDSGLYSVSAAGVYMFSAADVGRVVDITFTSRQFHTPNAMLLMVIVFAGHQCEEIGDIYFDDELIPFNEDGSAAGRLAGYAYLHKHLGSPDQEADAMIMAATLGKWTITDRLRGHTYISVQLVGNVNLYPNGIPNITAVIKGKNDIYDPRTSSRVYTDNAPLCQANYLEDTKYGMAAAMPSEFDIDLLITAANTSDEFVPKADGTSERRYTLNGLVDTSNTPEDIIGKMLSASGGRVIWSGGQWQVRVASYETPTLILDEGDARDTIKVTPLPSRRSQFNAVHGLYISPENGWQLADYPSITNATYEGEDGERIYQDMDLPYTNSASMSQRLAKIVLERQRQGISVEYPAKLIGMRVRAGDTILLNNARFGWAEKPFEVLDWTFSVFDDNGSPALGTNLVLRETAAAVYDWNSGEETTVDLAPNTNLPSAFTIGTPGLLTPVEELYSTRQGRGVAAKVTLTAIPADGFAQDYQFEWKLAEESIFRVIGTSEQPTIEVLDVASGIYDFRVKARNLFGKSSGYSQVRYEVKGLAAIPADLTGFTVQAISSIALLQWTLSPDRDVTEGGKILIRHSEAMTGAVWGESYSVTDPIPGNSTMAMLPLKGGTYLIKAQDGNENESANPATFATKDASTLSYSTLGSVTEDPDFLGTKTGVAVNTGLLELSGVGDFDAIPDFDAVADLDAYGGFSGAGTYNFDAGIDLGSIEHVRLFTELAVAMVQTSTLFDSRTGMIDDWTDFDGTVTGGVGSVGDCVIEVRETDDDPGASPVWSEWKRITTADYTARAFEFRAQLTSLDNTYNIRVSKLRASAKEVV